MQTNILLTGGSGSLGSNIIKIRRDILAPSHSELDITNIEQCKTYIEENKPKLIIHSAALTDLDYCENNKFEAFNVNAIGTKNLTELAKKYDIHLIYISTHAIFGQESAAGISEEDLILPPKNTYALSKLAAELFVRSLPSKQYLIVRLGWMLDSEAKRDKKFIGKVLNNIINNNAKEVNIVSDTLGSLSYALDVAEKILEYIDSKTTGVRHLVNTGAVSRYELIDYIVAKTNMNCLLNKVESSSFPRSVVLPKDSVLTTKYKGSKLRSWQAALDDFVSINFEEYKK
jgi:dTDP-4-dehydrorhamnose reductase